MSDTLLPKYVLLGMLGLIILLVSLSIVDVMYLRSWRKVGIVSSISVTSSYVYNTASIGFVDNTYVLFDYDNQVDNLVPGLMCEFMGKGFKVSLIRCK